MTTNDPRVIVALDFPADAPALAFVQQLSPDSCRVKVGKELFTAAGPALVKTLVDQGYSVFLDLKFHDIPHTVAAAVTAAAELGVWMVNVHASGGSVMMREAAQALQRFGSKRPLLTAVTVLTSMQQSDLQETGITEPLAERVLRLAKLAAAAGLDGVVCSGEEAPLLRSALGKDFCLVTPGIRPASTAKDDQKRVLTPAQAIANGSSYLVVGRPITQADNPQATIRTMNEEITYAVRTH